MSAPREGNLEAPTRHPIDWKNPEYYNEEKTFNELERIFDICHGCRRCVSLCGAFPTLFDLVDDLPVVGLGHAVDLARLAGVDQVEQVREALAQADAAPATVADLEDALHFAEALFFVVEVGALPVDRMARRRFEVAFSGGHASPSCARRSAWRQTACKERTRGTRPLVSAAWRAGQSTSASSALT